MIDDRLVASEARRIEAREAYERAWREFERALEASDRTNRCALPTSPALPVFVHLKD